MFISSKLTAFLISKGCVRSELVWMWAGEELCLVTFIRAETIFLKFPLTAISDSVLQPQYFASLYFSHINYGFCTSLLWSFSGRSGRSGIKWDKVGLQFFVFFLWYENYGTHTHTPYDKFMSHSALPLVVSVHIFSFFSFTYNSIFCSSVNY